MIYIKYSLVMALYFKDRPDFFEANIQYISAKLLLFFSKMKNIIT